MHIGEQPVDALKRSLQIHAGIEPETFKLRDVISFLDPDYRDTQYVFVVYETTIDRGDKVTTDDEYDRIEKRDQQLRNSAPRASRVKVVNAEAAEEECQKDVRRP